MTWQQKPTWASPLIIWRDKGLTDAIGVRRVEFYGNKALICANSPQHKDSRLNDLKLIEKHGIFFTYSLTYFGNKVYFKCIQDAGI